MAVPSVADRSVRTTGSDLTVCFAALEVCSVYSLLYLDFVYCRQTAYYLAGLGDFRSAGFEEVGYRKVCQIISVDFQTVYCEGADFQTVYCDRADFQTVDFVPDCCRTVYFRNVCPEPDGFRMCCCRKVGRPTRVCFRTVYLERGDFQKACL